MAQRALYIAAYDVSDSARLRDALRVLKGYASGRQKSVFECFLTDAEKRALLAEVRGCSMGTRIASSSCGSSPAAPCTPWGKRYGRWIWPGTTWAESG